MTSATLPVISPEVLAAFKKARPIVVHEVSARILRYTNWETVFGDKVEESLTGGMNFIVQSFESIVAVSAEAMIEQQLLWAKDYCSGVGIQPEAVLQSFKILSKVMEETMPDRDYPGLTPWLNRMITVQQRIMNAP